MPGVSATFPGHVLKYCEAHLPIAGRAETPSSVVTCAVTFMGYYLLGFCLKAFLFPAMQLEPKFVLAVELEI